MGNWTLALNRYVRSKVFYFLGQFFCKIPGVDTDPLTLLAYRLGDLCKENLEPAARGRSHCTVFFTIFSHHLVKRFFFKFTNAQLFIARKFSVKDLIHILHSRSKVSLGILYQLLRSLLYCFR